MPTKICFKNFRILSILVNRCWWQVCGVGDTIYTNKLLPCYWKFILVWYVPTVLSPKRYYKDRNFATIIKNVAKFKFLSRRHHDVTNITLYCSSLKLSRPDKTGILVTNVSNLSPTSVTKTENLCFVLEGILSKAKVHY